MRSQINRKKKNLISYNPNSFSSKLLETMEYLVGTTYIAFSRKSLIKKLQMDPSREGYKIFKALYNLERGDFIKKTEDDKYELTAKGVKRINFSKFFKLSFNKKVKDGFWRVIIFDIPESNKGKRELLRSKLKEFDFKMLQKSVFISPYVCEKEIAELCKILGLGDEVCIIVAKSLSGFEKKLKI